ncbi:iron-containing alcohol dehydrogenase [Shewanella sedimentimangrovi]|uniref:Iron-containing alcohol dehydrogenase n=1 Tax=Shewanella sedimentimangrovi TaxID=2814293 RepID=A0ABX7R251_9GAMM|nr:iron-containing alcohol dehydrogenase [Shewanella sedimentimangrovi]QSX37241.1 iron-containing alcohol dehydrogenase [Shewanella sedimentimangrovi]
MFNFNYRNPTHIVFGRDRLSELDKLVPANARVLVLYGGGSVKRFGTLARVLHALGNRTVFEFGGIEANPQYHTLMQAVELVRRESIDFLLAVGGGSVMDGTKFIAVAAPFEGDTSSLLYHGFNPAPATKVLPLGIIATLPATGSEMNPYAVISHNNGKHSLSHAELFPQFSLLDPSLSFSLPPIQVANGVVDAFVHVLEQYATYPVNARVQDRFAEGILRTLIEIGPQTVAEPDNYDARANLMWSATCALNGMLGVGVPMDWTSHMIGHELTALFGIDHAQTLAILLPAVWTERKSQKHAKLLQYAERVWDIHEGDEQSKVLEAIARTRDFFERLGLKTRLRDYGVARPDIDRVIQALDQHGMHTLSERGDINLEISRRILELAW